MRSELGLGSNPSDEFESGSSRTAPGRRESLRASIDYPRMRGRALQGRWLCDSPSATSRLRSHNVRAKHFPQARDEQLHRVQGLGGRLVAQRSSTNLSAETTEP